MAGPRRPQTGLVVRLKGCLGLMGEDYCLGNTDEVYRLPHPERNLTVSEGAVAPRRLVILQHSPHAYLACWSLLPDDPPGVAFHCYRRRLGEETLTCVTPEPIGHACRAFIPRTDDADDLAAYVLRSVVGGREGAPSEPVRPAPRWMGLHRIVLRLDQPARFARVSSGDLDGDGSIEFLVLHSPCPNVDPYRLMWFPSSHSLRLDAYRADGTLLWRHDLGPGVESGSWYAPVIVADVDGDGRAEVCFRANLSPDRLDYTHERTRILDGRTGQPKADLPWVSAEGLGSDYNRTLSRNLMSFASLDEGRTPVLVIARGTYEGQRLIALGPDLKPLWERAILDGTRGSHAFPAADVNADGDDELLWGDRCLSLRTGEDLWVAERAGFNGHTDIIVPAHVQPGRDDYQVYYCREGWGGKGTGGVLLVDARGKTVWADWDRGHVDMGWASRVLPEPAGMQCYALEIEEKTGGPEGMKRVVNEVLFRDAFGSPLKPPVNLQYTLPIDVNGDGLREIVSQDGQVWDWRGEPVSRYEGHVIHGANHLGDAHEQVVTLTETGEIHINFWPGHNVSKVLPLRSDRQYAQDISLLTANYHTIPFSSTMH